MRKDARYRHGRGESGRFEEVLCGLVHYCSQPDPVICFSKSFSRIRSGGTARPSHSRGKSFSYGRPGRALFWSLAAYWTVMIPVLIPLLSPGIRWKRSEERRVGK